MYLSVIIPVYNERENIASLVVALHAALATLHYEIIFIDDGSDDGTVETIIALNDPSIHLLLFSRNFGQTSALAAGIEAAQGRYIATLDGDMQNDPDDIPRMLAALTEHRLDMVTGRRINRQDGLLLRKIPSLVANFLIRFLTKADIHDHGCTLKVFDAAFAKKLELYGELHRFIPVLGSFEGAKIREMEVKHHPRQYGKSKYGLSRTIKVISDLLFLAFFRKYRQKPMHLFGTLGVTMFLGGSLIELYLLALKLAGENIGNRPLFYVGIMLIITSIQLITTGFLAELLMRIYYNTQNKKPYSVVQSINPQSKQG